MFYLLQGAIDLHLGEETYDLTEGDIARFEGDQEISSIASEDSTALIVLAPASETE